MDSTDPQIQRFVQQIQHEGEKQKFQEQILLLCSKCFDICVPDSRPPNRMDAKTQNCVTNCVDRMVDATEYIVQHFQRRMQTDYSSSEF